VKTVGQQGVEEGGKKGGLDPVHRLPYRVWVNYCDRVSSLYRLFTLTTLTLVTHNLSHPVL